MNTRTLTLAVSVFFIICTLISLPAHAWTARDIFKSSDVRPDDDYRSLDEMYASMSNESPDELPVMSGNAIIAVNSPIGGVQRTLRRTYVVQLSGYNSEVAQTDASPFITANGTHVRDGIVASNMFPFGTVLKIPSLYGDKLFVVEDRMNSRFRNNVDIWFVHKAEAIQLGRRTAQIVVIR